MVKHDPRHVNSTQRRRSRGRYDFEGSRLHEASCQRVNAECAYNLGWMMMTYYVSTCERAEQGSSERINVAGLLTDHGFLPQIEKYQLYPVVTRLQEVEDEGYDPRMGTEDARAAVERLVRRLTSSPAGGQS